MLMLTEKYVSITDCPGRRLNLEHGRVGLLNDFMNQIAIKHWLVCARLYRFSNPYTVNTQIGVYKIYIKQYLIK